MSLSHTRLAILLLVLPVFTTPSHAQIVEADFSQYALDNASTYSAGCFGPCDCAVIQSPLRGRFELKFTGSDPLFQNYDVGNLRWEVPQQGHTIEIVGSGKYRIGGEVALTQQM